MEAQVFRCAVAADVEHKKSDAIDTDRVSIRGGVVSLKRAGLNDC